MNIKETLSTKVIRINNRWHCRLLENGKPIDEMACELKCDIGYCCYTMLRWFDKCGGLSPMAHSARQRQKYNGPKGKVWWHILEKNKQNEE